ncbi:MAG: hypothetical protein NZL93_02550, partial [Chthoniobacterales bacterium]|nr:hypothetical protein [Chthoniobacterales bacterium]
MPPDSTTTPTTPQGKVWSRITTDDIEGRKFLVNLLGKDPLDNPAVSASESNEHVLLPIKLPLRQNGYYVETHLCLVLGKKWIATLEGEKRLSLLDRIEWDFAYDTSQDSPPSPFAVGLDILDALNAGTNQTIDG